MAVAVTAIGPVVGLPGAGAWLSSQLRSRRTEGWPAQPLIPSDESDKSLQELGLPVGPPLLRPDRRCSSLTAVISTDAQRPRPHGRGQLDAAKLRGG